MALRPAEWTRQARTILALPDKIVYAQLSDLITKDITSIARAVSRFQPVTLLVGTDRVAEAQTLFKDVPRVQIEFVPGGDLDLWMRDIGPTFVKKDSQVYGVNFNFNGWGNKHMTKTSSGLSSKILKMLQIQELSSTIITEGGALDVDGQGTLLATESSIINDNRNPGKSKTQIEQELTRLLGVSKFIWIPGRKNLDVTDCHVDALARFIRPGHVLLSTSTATSPWTDVVQETRQILSKETDATGQKLQVTEIQDADLYKLGLEDKDLKEIEDDMKKGFAPALNYVNFLMVNGAVLVPQFGDSEADANALKVFKGLFDGEREVVPVPLTVLGLMGGVIHCSSQEVPY